MTKMIQFSEEKFIDLKNDRQTENPDVEIPGALLQQWMNKEWKKNYQSSEDDDGQSVSSDPFDSWLEPLEVLSLEYRENPDVVDKGSCV